MSFGLFYFIVFIGLSVLCAVLMQFGLVPDPYTYWLWVGAVILLLAIGFAAIGGRRWL